MVEPLVEELSFLSLAYDPGASTLSLDESLTSHRPCISQSTEGL